MTMKTLAPLCCALFMLCLLPATPRAESLQNSADGLKITADSMNHSQADDIIVATGKVEAAWRGANLSADTLTYDRTSRKLRASGQVVITRGKDTVRGESVDIDLDSGRGELSKGEIFLHQNNMRITGDKISKTGDEDYRTEQGSYTTCNDPVPAWKFSADKLDLTIEEYGTANNVVFYIKDVPLLYLPYAIFPVKRERQSGFLFPRFGWSNKKGAQADIFYYWAISPSQEATIDLDVQTRRGVGIGLDYRYLRKMGSTGNLGGYLIYDLNTENLRGFIAQSHREILSPDMNVRTSINMTSDRRFLSEYGEKSGDYNRQSNDSTVNFLKTWQHYALTGNLRYTQDYYATSNSSTLQTLPEIGLGAVRQQLFSLPVYFDLDSTASNFYRETGPRGQRLYAFPRLTLVHGIPGYISASVTGGLHLRGYATEGSSAGSTTDGNLLPEGTVRIATSLAKIYEPDLEHLKKLRHEITPEVRYQLSGSRNQSDLPSYDARDRLPHLSLLHLALTSTLGGKFTSGETAEYRDIMRLRLSQGYSFNGNRQDLLTRRDDQRPWTDLMLESETWITPGLQILLDGRLNVYDRRLTSTTAGLQYDNRMGTTASLGYHMRRGDVDYIEGRLSTRLLFPWILGYSTRYSFDRQNFLESVYTVEYRHQCWNITLNYNDRRVTNAGQSVTFSFNLLGAFGGGSGAAGAVGK